MKDFVSFILITGTLINLLDNSATEYIVPVYSCKPIAVPFVTRFTQLICCQ